MKRIKKSVAAELVADWYDVNCEDMVSARNGRKTKTNVLARRMFVLVCRETLKLSTSEIAEFIGTDHGTVLVRQNAAIQLKNTNEEFKQDYITITHKLLSMQAKEARQNEPSTLPTCEANSRKLTIPH